MNKVVFSIEPLSDWQKEYVEKHAMCKVVLLDRENAMTSKPLFDVEVLIARDRDNVEHLMDNFPNLKFLFIVSTGVEKLPFKRLDDANIYVANTGGINSEIMSQYAIAYILADSARVCENFSNQEKHYWKPYQCVDSLEGKTILIVGVGRTGKLIAHKARALGMNCLGVKKHPIESPEFEKMVRLEQMEQLLPQADYVVCCLPLTPETKDVFAKGLFERMKSTAMFINLSRGKCVNIKDLVRALSEGVIKRAVLDVFPTEPIDADSELWDVPNLWITPHSSGRLENFMDEAMKYFVDNYIAFINNTKLPNEVNLKNGY